MEQAATATRFFDQPRGVGLIAATEFWERFSYYGFIGLVTLFMAADPADYEGLILGHLDGQEELFLETRVGFDVDGIETKARLDVGAAMIDHRGWYKNPG